MLKKRKPSTQSSFLMPTLNEQCDPRHPLRKLGERVPWRDFEEAFGEYYSEEGRPAKPVDLSVQDVAASWPPMHTTALPANARGFSNL
jgi:hypothetical protein